MQRYNQGFGGFGPMEKCDSGKWAEATDAEKTIAKKEALAKIYETLWTRSMIREVSIRLRLYPSAILAVAGWSIIAAALLKYAFTGHIL